MDRLPDFGFRALFELLLDQAPLGFALIDPDLRYRLVNDALAAMIGVPADEVRGRAFAEVLPDVATSAEPLLRHVLATGEPVLDDEVVAHAGSHNRGPRVWLRRYHRITSAEGDVLGVAALVVDVTDQRRQEQRLRNVLDALFTFVGVCSPDGRLIEVNRAALEAGGVTADEVVGRAVWETCWWSWDAGVQRDLRRALERAAEGASSRYDVDIRVTDGHITIDFQVTPLEEDGRVTTLVVSAADISDRRRRLDQLSALTAFATKLNAAVTTEDVARSVSEVGASALATAMATVSVIDINVPGLIRVVSTDTLPAELADRFGTQVIEDSTATAEAIRTGHPVLLTNAAEASVRFPHLVEARAAAQIEASAALPLRRADGDVFGAVVFGWCLPVDFGQQTLLLLETVVGMCAQALERTRLSDAGRELAHALQRQLLPSIRPIEGLDIAVRYLPSITSIGFGGDWYDVFAIDEQRAVVVIGDVVGHGISAAARMAEIRAVVNTLVRSGVGLDELFMRAGPLLQHLDEPFLATVAVALIELGDEKITYVAAGHPPLLLSRPDGEVVVLDDGRQPPVGMVDRAVRVPSVAFPAGAALVAFTDGLVERRDEDIDVGIERIAAALQCRPGMESRLTADLLLAEQIAGRRRTDDLALVVVRRPF